MLLELFRWLEVNLPGGAYLRESTFGFSALLTVHVVSLCIFFGLILMMDLRLVGVGNLRTRAAECRRGCCRGRSSASSIMAVTGVALVWAQPLRYYGKTFFWWKMGLMVLAGVNAGIIHLITANRPPPGTVGPRSLPARRRSCCGPPSWRWAGSRPTSGTPLSISSE